MLTQLNSGRKDFTVPKAAISGEAGIARNVCIARLEVMSDLDKTASFSRVVGT